MSNCIAAAIRDSGLSIAEVSRRSGINYATVHDAAKGRTNIDRMGIDTFMKIAHSLGMTVDALYDYGSEEVADGDRYADPRQKEINDIYESVTEDGKQQMWVHAVMVRNTFSERNGGNTVQTAI